MEVNHKVLQIIDYLQAVKGLNYRRIRNIDEYEEVFYENEICNLAGVTVIENEENDNWLEIDKTSKELYDKFSKLYLTLEKNSESLEVIYGHGLFIGNIGGAKIVHPIFTTKIDLIFNEKDSKFFLKPYNNVTNMELDMLLDLQQSSLSAHKGPQGHADNTIRNNIDLKLSLENILSTCEKVKALGVNPRVQEEVKAALEIVSSNLNLTVENKYNKIQSLLELEGDENLCIYDEPVIIFRKVDTRLWSMELNSIREKLIQGFKVPKTIEALITEEKLQLSEEEEQQWITLGEELLFPLPYNEEQKEITKRLSKNFGVVVQGPPGTGKSHTIVNLICHLLAHGKRVLVTSQTDRALKVLNNKIPEEIKSLCISILGDDSKSMEDLDEAVRKITEKLSLDTTELKKDIKTLKYSLNHCGETKEQLLESLKEVYNKENTIVIYKNNSYSVATMAKFLKENLDKLSYIQDDLPLNHEESLSNEGFENLITLYKKYPKTTLDLYESYKNYIDKLPEQEKVVKTIEAYKMRIKDIYIHRAAVAGWIDKDITSFTNSNLMQVLEEAIEILKKYECTLMEPILSEVYENEAKREFWNTFFLRMKEDLKEIYSLKAAINRYNITFPEAMDMVKFRRDFEQVYNVLATKGKVGAMFKVFHKDMKYIFQEILIDGEKLESLNQGEIIKDWLDSIKLEKAIKTYYNTCLKDYEIPMITEGDSNYLTIVESFIKEIQVILEFEENYKNKIISLLKAKRLNRELNFYKREAYEYIKEVLISLKAIKEFEEVEMELEEVKKALSKQKCVKELHEKVQDLNLDYVKRYYEKVNYIKEHKSDLEELLQLNIRLKEICPIFQDTISKSAGENLSISFENFEEALKYAAFNSYIKELLKVDVKSIEKKLYEENLREGQIIREIVAKKSWYNQIERTTEGQKRSLFTWMEAIKRIGKGTGTQAIKYRKLAQKEMENCKDVIPVWIMPINRVIENLKINETMFDVVIVDESSQSDVSALTVLMRGERAVIVGDEKQISPEAIGKNSEKVDELINLHLKDIKHKEWFDLKTSLYNTALRVFPDRLVLKEHFRSLEEIIGFSNGLCYSEEIIPLRPSSRKNLLEKPIVTVRVEEGFRDSSKAININEAYSIVETISSCCKNPIYSGMTMGVISLLGEAQAELIENMLIEKIGIEEMVYRNLVCGDAYSFQGDERDVMFLSMVVGSNVKFAALSKDSDIRRFNVAASRAKNQMWLFHSVALEELSPKCVRSKLLGYMENCDSFKENNEAAATLLLTDFAEEVQEEILKEGLKVYPNFKIGKYVVDFLIEGNNKVAVRLIGDNNYSNFNFQQQYEEQYTLERAGWKFLKIRSSEFYLDKAKVMNKIKASAN